MVVTRLATGDDGRPVLVKEGEGLAREAAVLAAARHPGVVEVASWSPAEDRLVLRFAGSRSLADHRPPLEVAARLAAAVAATVADLHDLGIRHGRIAPSRVVIDGSGRPVLCGFAGAALAGEDGPTTADDVAGLGTVLRSLAGPDGELEPIPERRLAPRARWSGPLRRAMLTLADHATADEPARRPTARSLAASLAALAPDGEAGEAARYPWSALLASRHDRRPDARHGRHVVREPAQIDDGDAGAPRRLPLVAAAVGLGLVAFGATTVLRAPSAPADSIAPPPTTSPRSQVAAAPPTVAACPPVDPDLPAADHDGDGCPSAVRVDAGVVEVDGIRYGVGAPGDVVAVGDWDCDGAATVAVVRPATGEVFVFDGWGASTVDSVATVPGGAAIEAGECVVVVVDGAGRRTEVAA